MHTLDKSIQSRLLSARLPAIPQILIKLIDLCQKEEAGMDQIAKLIAHDAGMTAKILNIANSSAYRLSSSTLGLLQSLSILGNDLIKTLVITESTFQTFNRFARSTATDMRGFWVHSLKAAVIARELAKKMSYPHTEEAYLAGLLHDVGRLALLSAAPEEYPPIFQIHDDRSLCQTETDILGINHAEAGAWLIEQWRLDPFLSDSVHYHHETIESLKSAHPLIRIVSLANQLSHHEISSPALEGAGVLCDIEDADLQSILVNVNSYTRTAATYFGIALQNGIQSTPPAKVMPRETGKNPSEDLLAEKIRNAMLASAASQSFRTRGSEKDILESIAQTSRVLFNFEDVIVLRQSANGKYLKCSPIGDNQQRLDELSIPLDGNSIITDAVIKRRVSFAGKTDNTLSLAEKQLIRFMGTECMVIMPLLARKTCLGILLGGLTALQCEEIRAQEQLLREFARQAATSFESAEAARNETEIKITSLNDNHLEASRRVIHEVNNPLSIIKNYLSILDDKVINHEPVSEELSVINEEIDRVGRIIGGLAEQETTAHEEITEVNGLLKEVVRLFSISRYLPDTVSITVRTTNHPAEITCPADPIKQILLNLIKNAVEALPMGGKIEVRNNGLMICEGGEFIEISVNDSGPGIPPDILPNLFSPVQSSKNGNNRGLGLNIVQNLIKKINGVIYYRSGPSGTTFEIRIPTCHNMADMADKSKYAASMK